MSVRREKLLLRLHCVNQDAAELVLPTALTTSPKLKNGFATATPNTNVMLIIKEVLFEIPLPSPEFHS